MNARRILSLTLAVSLAPVACGGSHTVTITEPPPPIAFTPQVLLTAVSPAPQTISGCVPQVTAQLSGPAGTRLTWKGMTDQIGSGTADQLDSAFTVRFWGSDGLSAGERVVGTGFAFDVGSGTPITLRFSYVISGSPSALQDSVTVECQ